MSTSMTPGPGSDANAAHSVLKNSAGRRDPGVTRGSLAPLAKRKQSRAVSIIASASLAFAIFFPSLISAHVSLRIVVVIIGIACLALEVSRRSSDPSAGPLTLMLLTGYAAAVFILTTYASQELGDSMIALNGQRLFVVLPLFIALGALASTSVHRNTYATVLVVVAVCVGVLAVIESTLGYSIFGQEDLFARSQRSGTTRALLASENVLVLGAMLAACIPLVPASLLRHHWIFVLILLAGSWSTGSRAPTVLAGIVAIVQLVPGSLEHIRRMHMPIKVLAVVLSLSLMYLAFFVWDPIAYGQGGADYSAGYRFAIYALLPLILVAVPFGYGLAAPPSGVWLFQSESRGVRDLVDTADSEVLYASLSFGVVGVVAFFVAMWISVSALRWSYPIAMSGLVISMSGLVLALHAWDSLGPLWYMTIGAGWIVSLKGRKSLESSRQDAVH